MPGVPSGKGCDACRKQKKKCDLGKPSCARCARLRIPCIGAGTQRYKFKDQSAAVKRTNSDSSSEQQRSESNTPDPAKAAAAAQGRTLSRSPSNEVSALASAIVQAVRPETSWRYNIAYAYGGFVALIPPRLGRNAALDASAAALTQAHSEFCTHRQVSRSALTKYSQALTKLRICLSDPTVAKQSETLCSVMLLLITQSFIGTGDCRPAASHVVGMAKLLKVRGTHHDPHDPFESLLLLTLRGPVVFEGLWNDQVQFSESQWKELVENHWDDDQRAEGIMMKCMAKMPLYVLRGRKVLRGEAIDPTLAQEVDTIYHQLLGARKQMEDRLENLEKRLVVAGPELGVITQIRDAVKRIHSFHLSVIIITGCILGTLSEFTPELQAMLNNCAAAIYEYVPFAQQWRPLGSSYMLLSLSMAWTGTNDPDLKAKVQAAYVDQHGDFPGDVDGGSIVETLAAGSRKFLSLGTKGTVCTEGMSWGRNEDELDRVRAINTTTLPERHQYS